MRNYFLLAFLFSCLFGYGQKKMLVYFDNNSKYCKMEFDTVFNNSSKPIYIGCTIRYMLKDSIVYTKTGYKVYSRNIPSVELYYCVNSDSQALKEKYPELLEYGYTLPEKALQKKNKKWLRSQKIFIPDIIGQSEKEFQDFTKKAVEGKVYVLFKQGNSAYIQQVRYKPQIIM